MSRIPGTDLDDLVHRAPGKADSKAPGRRIETLAIRPGISIYLGAQSYADTTLHVSRHPRLKMWDAGTHCLLQAVDEHGKVIDEAELLWHGVWWRKMAKQ